jgi:hypothetical protein
MLESRNQPGQSINGAIPLIIGVTGHRDLRSEDLSELRKQVRKVCAELRAKYPATPLWVLSPLAEGADRLAAEVALELGAQLIVPLPLPPAEYEKDFSAPESKAEFNQLFGQATKCFQLPLMPGNTLDNIQPYGPPRDRQYAQVGAYIVRYSQILIALWNGTDTGLEGGTAQIVGFKLNGIAEPYAPPHNPLDAIDTGPVYHLVTPRQKNQQLPDRPFSWRIKFPDGGQGAAALRQANDRMLSHLNAYNRDLRRLAKKLAAKIEENKSYVMPAEKQQALSPAARTIFEQYGIADTLAIHFQNWRKWTLRMLFVLALLAVVSFEVYAHLLSRPWVLALYPLTLGAALLLYFLARRKDFHHKHLDYRALAEGLRVQLFWELSGLPDEAADHYLRKQRTELDWIRNAIRSCRVAAMQACDAHVPPIPSAAMMPSDFQPLTELTLEHWVKDQEKYFAKVTGRDHLKLRRHELAANYLFGFGLVFAIAVTFLHSRFGHVETYAHLHHWLIVIMGTAPAIAAAMSGYAEKMAFSAQTKRYRWMQSLFARASAQLEKLLSEGRVREAQQLILDLGKESLEENGDWVMIHREREMEVPKG